MYPLRPDYLKFLLYQSEILLLSLRPMLRVQDVRILMNSSEYYSKLIAVHRDTTDSIELLQNTGFSLFAEDVNSISLSIRK